MKKIYLMTLLFVTIGLTGCQPAKKENTKDSVPSSGQTKKKSPFSKVTEKVTDSLTDSYEEEKSTLQQVDTELIINAFTDYLSLFTFQDNMIGNLSYNFTEEMTADEFKALEEIIKDYFVPEREELLELHESAQIELEAFEWDEVALKKFTTTLDEVVQQQNRWAEEISKVTLKTAGATKALIDKESTTYITDSIAIGMNLSNLLLTSGFSEIETSEIAQTALYNATLQYGDPTDLEAFDGLEEFDDTPSEEELEEILRELEEMVEGLSDMEEGI